LSESARRILLDEREESSERVRLIEEAALRPTIHAELWADFDREGSMPSEANLRHRLRFEHSFTDNALREFIPQLRSTLQFAGLVDAHGALARAARGDVQEGADNVGVAPLGHSTGATRQAKPPFGTSPVGASTLQIPLAPGEFATISAAFPLTEEKWDQLLSVLEVFKKGLIARPDESSPGDAGGA
jgi:hypothetical protein